MLGEEEDTLDRTVSSGHVGLAAQRAEMRDLQAPLGLDPKNLARPHRERVRTAEPHGGEFDEDTFRRPEALRPRSTGAALPGDRGTDRQAACAHRQDIPRRTRNADVAVLDHPSWAPHARQHRLLDGETVRCLTRVTCEKGFPVLMVAARSLVV